MFILLAPEPFLGMTRSGTDLRWALAAGTSYLSLIAGTPFRRHSYIMLGLLTVMPSGREIVVVRPAATRSGDADRGPCVPHNPFWTVGTSLSTHVYATCGATMLSAPGSA